MSCLRKRRGSSYNAEGQLMGTFPRNSKNPSRKERDAIPEAFPEKLKKERLYSHILISHHGEMNSAHPKLAMIREGQAFHDMDDMGLEDGSRSRGPGNRVRRGRSGQNTAAALAAKSPPR